MRATEQVYKHTPCGGRAPSDAVLSVSADTETCLTLLTNGATAVLSSDRGGGREATPPWDKANGRKAELTLAKARAGNRQRIHSWETTAPSQSAAGEPRNEQRELQGELSSELLPGKESHQRHQPAWALLKTSNAESVSCLQKY